MIRSKRRRRHKKNWYRNTFNKIDRLLFICIKQISEYYDFIEKSLWSVAVDTLLRRRSSRVIWRHRTKHSKSSLSGLLIQDLLILLSNPDNRDAAISSLDRWSRHLLRLVFVEICMSFLDLTKPYIKAIDEGKWKEAAIIGGLIGDTTVLYGVVKNVRKMWVKVGRARDVMLIAHENLAIKTGRAHSKADIQLQDNIQHARIGLTIAIFRYDQFSRTNFVTFAAQWMRQQILLRIKREENIVYAPVGVWQTLHKARMIDSNTTQQSIMDDTGSSAQYANRIYAIAHANHASRVVTPDFDHGITDDAAILDPEQLEEQEHITQALKEALSDLSVEEQRVVCLRFGLLSLLPGE